MAVEPQARHKLGIEGTSNDMFNDNFDEDSTTSPNFLDISSPSLPKALLNEAKVAVARVKSSEVSIPSSCLSLLAAPNSKPYETISSF
ncbi:hypothetical protein HAX54_039740 [Datura stramonium]|uniref:Uncharacterized protein n=1 Tax=Datura stramonium TaxID=4076 RepID=A0ABS8VPX9_DATST|nr:hypothetical protein [Datura stramonium]